MHGAAGRATRDALRSSFSEAGERDEASTPHARLHRRRLRSAS
ncbi:Hypothetical protein A7982_06432 [Minicystis rosea]|nr:Hypothetical protein A7982_06432 [Minicystis rosea]